MEKEPKSQPDYTPDFPKFGHTEESLPGLNGPDGEVPEADEDSAARRLVPRIPDIRRPQTED